MRFNSKFADDVHEIAKADPQRAKVGREALARDIGIGTADYAFLTDVGRSFLAAHSALDSELRAYHSGRALQNASIETLRKFEARRLQLIKDAHLRLRNGMSSQGYATFSNWLDATFRAHVTRTGGSAQ